MIAITPRPMLALAMVGAMASTSVAQPYSINPDWRLVDRGSLRFAPDDTQLDAWMVANGDAPGKGDVKLVVDLLDRRTRLYKGRRPCFSHGPRTWRPQRAPTLRPGSFFQAHVLGSAPDLDKVVFSYAFFDLHLAEGEASFASLVSGKSPQVATKSKVEHTASANELELYVRLAAELEDLKMRMMERGVDQKAIVDAILTYLAGSVEARLKVSLDQLKALGDTLLTIVALDHQGTFAGLAAGAIRQINSLQAWKTVSDLSVQVEDADGLEVIITGTKDTDKVFERKLTLYTGGGFKIDGSAGVGITDLMDDEYGTRSRERTYAPGSGTGDTTVTELVIRAKDGGELRVGVTALVHAYYRLWPFLNVGLTTGLMTTDQSQLVYQGGLSLILGRGQRMILSGGMATARVDRLASGYTEGDVVKDDASIPIDQVQETGFWFGVSYNLTAERRMR